MRFLGFLLLLWSCSSTPSSSTLPPASENPPTAETRSTESPSAPTEKPVATPPKEAENNSDWEIVPGKRIGQTSLGEDPENLLQRLGPPDASDAAMGKSWLVWRGKSGGELAVFTSYADSKMVRKAVRQIHVTSSRFQTTEGAHTGISFPEIQRLFPKGQLSTTETGMRYDLELKGISFEIGKDNLCDAVMIYTPGSAPTAYLPIPGK